MEMSDASTIGRETLRFYRLWLFIGLGLVFIWTWTGVNCPVVQAVVMGPDPTQRAKIAADENATDKTAIDKTAADKTATEPRLFIVSIPGLSFQEIESLREMPEWRRVAASAAFAAMNVRTPESGIEDVYLSIGAGAPAVASRQDQAYMAGETVRHFGEEVRAVTLYERYAGVRAHDAAVVVPAFWHLDGRNRSLSHSARVGALGEMLKTNGVSRYVFGNRDRTLDSIVSDQAHVRHAPLMLVDEAGLVDGGEVGADMLVADHERPFGVKTRYARLLTELKERNGPAVLLVELGDLERLYAAKDHFAPERFVQLKRAVLAEIVTFIRDVAALCAERDGLWIMSPLSHAEARKDKSLLTPFYALDQQLEGWIGSGTTRRAGIVSYLDLAPTILDRFGLGDHPPEMRGSKMESATHAGGHEKWIEEINRIENVYRLRTRFSYPYIICQAAVLLFGLWRVFVSLGPRASALLRGALLATMSAPALLLLLGKLPGLPHGGFLALFGVGLTAVGYSAARARTMTALFAIGAVTSMLIVSDGLFGAEMMKRSVLGYDPVIGARYYGIGNEYMGVLIGSSLLALSAGRQMSANSGAEWFSERAHFIMMLIVFIVVVLYLAAPFWGTNAGGALAACVAYAAYVLISRKYAEIESRVGKVNGFRQASMFVLSLFVALALGVFTLWLFNTKFVTAFSPSGAAPGQSHIGKAFDALLSGRYDMITDLIWRKVSMNLRLLSVSFWSKLLVVGLLTMAMTIAYIRKGKMRSWHRRFPYVAGGSAAITIGAFAAFLVNDSGIVAAATMIVYAAIPVLLFSYRNDSQTA